MMVTTKDRGTELDDRSVIDAITRSRQSRDHDSRAGFRAARAGTTRAGNCSTQPLLSDGDTIV